MENIKEKIKDNIIDLISVSSSGRLIILKPEKKVFGEDLSVSKRADYNEKNILIKIISLIGPSDNAVLQKDFSQEDIKSDDDFYFIFVYFDIIRQKMGDYVWMMPSLKLKELAKQDNLKNNNNIFAVKILLDNKEKNKYSEFSIPVKKLGKFILDLLNSKKTKK
jgi:hypothetical protein